MDCSSNILPFFPDLLLDFIKFAEFNVAQLSENLLGNCIFKYSLFYNLLLGEFVGWWKWVAEKKKVEVLNIDFKESIIANLISRANN